MSKQTPIGQTIRPRWKPENDAVPRLASAKRIIDQSSDAHDLIRAAHARFQNDANLTALGRQDGLRKYVATNIAPTLHRSEAVLSESRAALTKWKERLEKAPAVDKTDFASAVLRSQHRDRLAKMKDGERIKILTDPNTDQVILAAARESPWLAGLSNEMLRIVMPTWVERDHPGQLAQIDQAQEAYDLAEAAFRIAESTVQRAADFPDVATLKTFVVTSLGDRAAAIAAAGEREANPMIL